MSSSLSSTPASSLPPGMVLGPDGKPCKVCTSFRNWRPPSSSSKKATTKTHGSGASNDFSSPTTATAIATATATAVSAHHDAARAYCPPDSEALGRATWTFLHSTAVARTCCNSLPTLYPCGHCAEDLGERLRRRPPDVRNRAALADERWQERPKDGSCDM
ncbi:hypothetical protein V8E53_012821 [Lactarius tabidus]